MLDILRPRLQEYTEDMQRKRDYYFLLTTLHEMDYLDSRILQIQAEMDHPSQTITMIGDMLVRMGLSGKISRQAPALQCIFTKGFKKIAEQSSAESASMPQRTLGGVLFARGADQETYDCSSLIAGILIGEKKEASPRFTLAFATAHSLYRHKTLTTYPFMGSIPREYISGDLAYRNGRMETQVDSYSPSALKSLRIVMEKPSRRRSLGSIPIEEATASLLSHFFVKTTTNPFHHFSQFYQPLKFLYTVAPQ